MRRRGILIILAFLLTFFMGLGILLYPAINNYCTSKRMESTVDSFLSTEDAYSDDIPSTGPIVETEPTTPHSELLKMMRDYNQKIYENGQ